LASTTSAKAAEPPSRRRRDVAAAGHTGDDELVRAALDDPDPAVRATALGAMSRLGLLTEAELDRAAADPEVPVRRRSAELSSRLGPGRLPALVAALGDEDPRVVEAACFALGELGPDAAGAVAPLSAVTAEADDPLCREAAVAALGSIGDDAALPAILAATTDKPAVRRRAVLALAPFEGPEVDAALERALTDRDWQVRQAAEDLTADDEDDA
jgi:HEAT repeat protein